MVALLWFSMLELHGGSSFQTKDRYPTYGKDITVGKHVSTPSPFSPLENRRGVGRGSKGITADISSRDRI